VLNGLAAPVVEELYFRGYLLPRLARFGAWAPLVNAVLFTIYHFWQPYAYLSILALMLPFIYLVWWKRNVYLGIAIHCAINIVGNLLLFGALLSQAK
jgi:membrane protease YdiL (CAAX protease family)